MDGEVLECSREIGNRSDPYAVAVTKSSGEAGGRMTVPHKISSICSIFIRRGAVLRRLHGDAIPRIWHKADWKYPVY